MNFFVIKYDLIPSKSSQGNLHEFTFYPFLFTLSSILIFAPWIIRNRMMSPFPSSIYFSSEILNVSSAIYKGHLCYFKHLHSKVDLGMIYFISYIEDLNWEFEDPFFWLMVAVFVINKLKQLMNLPFSSSKIAFGLAPASSIFLAVS